MPCPPEKVEDLFHAALGCDPELREAFIVAECNSDPHLMAEVQSLIKAHEQIGKFLEPSSGKLLRGIDKDALVSSVGESIGRFKILSLLGKGGMGEVYLAEDSRLGRKVALKSLRSTSIGDLQAKKRLIREARAAATLDHPNICAIYEVDEHAELSFIVMQYIEGDTLSNRIRNEGVSVSESLDVAIQVADALTAAHSNGIVHRDIKPQNIIVDLKGQVKVLDFGLAKEFHIDESHDAISRQSSITGAGLLIGTVAYMSPEQAKGQSLDGRSDLFSLGAMLYECVAGRPPFSGDTVIEVCAQVIHVEPPPPSSFNPLIPPELDVVVLKALAKGREFRYQSASDFMNDLRRIQKIDRPAQAPALSPMSGMLMSRIRSFSIRTPAARKLAVTSAFAAVAGLLLLALWSALRLTPAAPYQPSAKAREFYTRGVNSLQEGAYYQATKSLGFAVGIDSKFAMAHARLAQAWLELDYWDKAKDELLLANTLVQNKSALPPADSLYLEAVAATLRRDQDAAVALYTEIAGQADTSSQKARAYLELGHAQIKNEEFDKAMESYSEAANLDPSCAAAYWRLGNLYGRQQELQKATENLDKAEEIYKATDNFEGLAEVYYQRGSIANSLDRAGEAQQLLERGLELTRATKNKHQQIKLLLQLCSVAYTQGNTTIGAQYANEAIDLARADNLENLTTLGLIDLGNTFFQKGQFAEAEQYFKQALEYAERYKGRYSEAWAMLSLGSLSVQRGDADHAAKYLEEALAFFQQGGYRKETSQALILMGRVNRERGEYDAALQAFEQQLELATKVGDQSQEALARANIGTVLGSFLDRYPEALTQFEQSRRIDESLGSQLYVGYDLLDCGTMLWQLGRPSEARAALNRAAAMASHPEGGYKQLLAAINLSKARLELSQRKLAEAESRSRMALELAGDNYKDTALQARSVLGLAQALTGKAQAGSAMCAEAVELAKTARNPRLFNDGVLALSEATRLNGDAQNALAYAMQAQEFYARHGQQHSEWNAWLSAALAENMLGHRTLARENASRAAGLLSSIRQRFGEDSYLTYLSRPDVQDGSRQIETVLAANQ